MKETQTDVRKLPYETPDIEVIEFSLEESIATSGALGYSTLCGEETY